MLLTPSVMVKLETAQVTDIAGRGTILVVNLAQNDLILEHLVTGERLRYLGVDYRIRGVEGARNLFDGAIGGTVGIQVTTI